MIELLARVAHLALLAFGPTLASPEPVGDPDGVVALLGVVLLVAPLAYAVHLYRSYGVLESKAAVALWVLADFALLYEAHATKNAGVPLLRGYYFAAPALFCAVGATLATLAGQHLGSSIKNKRMAAFIVTVGIGIFVFRGAHAFVASTKAQWREVLKEDPAHDRALAALTDELASSADGSSLEACVAKRPGACICRTLRAERALNADRSQAAVEEMGHAACDGDPASDRAAAARALALARVRRFEEAEAIATDALARRPDDPKLVLAVALSHHARGEADALDLARQAAKAGGGRLAERMVVELLIQRGQLDEAKTELDTYLKQHPDDPEAVYNAAYIADKKGDYNKAREGYLRADGLRPGGMADARLNLVYLAWRFNFQDEARHHARKFAASFPDDPRKAELLRFVD